MDPLGSPKQAALARLLTGRLRGGSFGRAAATSAIGVAVVVAGLEVAARLVPVDPLRALEAAALAAGLFAAAVLHARGRPRADSWRTVADRSTDEAGVFSAAAMGSAVTTLAPLVHARAEVAAAELLARPRDRRLLPLRGRQAVLAVVLAAMTLALPGRRPPAGELDAGVQARLLAEVRSLENEAGRDRSPADKDLLARTAAALEARRCTAEEARRLAERLDLAASDGAAKQRALADALAKNLLFRDLAVALRRQDPAALDRALEALADRVRHLEARSPEALAAASLLLELASAEKDAGLKKALADAGQALAGSSGSGDAERLLDLGPPLRRLLKSSQAIRDVVVTLESATNPNGPGDRDVARAGTGPGPGEAPGLGGASAAALPLPTDYRSLIRPGTSDEAVLRRYFALP